MTDGGRDRDLPHDFSRWDRDSRVEYLRLGRTRADLLGLIRGYIGSDRGGDRLDKRELAAIADDLRLA